ncbi:MAG: O-antigen ligase family protein [Armatimonadota bacterium]|nr:O-antigen ligase family protein [Armatimonadota bacterium]
MTSVAPTARRLETVAGKRMPTTASAARIAWPLAVLAFVYPFHTYVRTPLGVFNISLADPVVALTLLVLAVKYGGALPVPPAAGALALIVAAAAASVAGAVLPPAAPYFLPAVGIAELAKLCGVLAWLVTFYVLLRPHVGSGLRAFTAVSLATATAFALWTVFESLAHQRIRPIGPFENPNIYANYLIMNLFFAWLWFGWTSQRRSTSGSLIPLACIPVLLLAVVATGSRGGLLGLAAGTMVVLWGGRGRSSPHRLAGLVIFVASAYAVGAFLQGNPFIAGRLEGLADPAGPYPPERLALWSAAGAAFFEAPLLGIGYGQFPQYAALVHGLAPKVAHSTYLSFAAETGVLGILALGWLLVVVARMALRSGRLLGGAAQPLLGFLVATLVQGMFANVEHFRSLWIAVAMLAAVVSAASVTYRAPAAVVRGRQRR